MILPPPRNKLNTTDSLRTCGTGDNRMKYVLVEAYYQQRNDPFERDNTAAAFHASTSG